MIISAVIQALFKLTLAVIAILVARGTLIWMDRRLRINLFVALAKADPNAQVIYFAARIVGICVLVGLVVS